MDTLRPVRIGNWLVSYDSETFRIFPKNKRGETVPVTITRHFLYLQDVRTGTLISLKRYRHRREWYWRDSRDPKPTMEFVVIGEVARLLFGGDRERAKALLTRMLLGQPLQEQVPALAA